MAFTLAEVLIVLGIIGLIADMTIPTLISSTQEKVAVSRLKKAYATLDGALRLAVAENGTVDNWLAEEASYEKRHLIVYNNLKPYLKIMRDCGVGTGCWTKGYLRSMTGVNYGNYDNSREPKIQLADGTALMFYAVSAGQNDMYGIWGNIKVDINGFNGTYQWGKDVFIFNILKDRIVPDGVQGSYYKFEDYCSLKNLTRDSGSGCTAWVIYSENMDYLHCDDLSWDGKKKCSD